MTKRLSVALTAAGGLVLLAVALSLVPWSWLAVVASRWSVLLPAAGGSAMLIGGVVLRRRDGLKHELSAAPVPPGRQVRPLRSWVIPAGIVLVGVVTWVAVTRLQESVPTVGDGVERAKLRVESIRTGLTIGASVTAAFALLLAFRRQQLAERTQQATEYDAGEKRVTELYVKAADQLGAIKAPVRLAGLYALERLAHDNPVHRQSIVEVICAYLRMPYTPPDDQPATEPNVPPTADGLAPAATPNGASGDSDIAAMDPRDERQVRLAAQRILARHLRPTTAEGKPNPLYWGAKVVLDLSEAVLIDLDFAGCHLHKAVFTKAQLAGDAVFGGATFSGGAVFGGATFSGGALFSRARFSGYADFNGAKFSGYADFDGAAVSGYATFGKVAFGGYAVFGGVAFGGHTVFREATFGDGAGFGGARFSSGAEFSGARFSSYAMFGNTTFSGHAAFGKATFSGNARFSGATFSNYAMFGETVFGGYAMFVEARFIREAGFGGAIFDGDADFGGATFGSDTWFDEATFSGDARFSGVTFSRSASFGGATHAGARYEGPEPVTE
ncbi:pentapeptide repeat-containing protein [Micromonospora tulbaghiae]|uniref:pentapeptide repeat-containing protein n=1 Tax=Micromonospora tulbaghiae TaxID=479978 RepID=UPI00366413CA